MVENRAVKLQKFDDVFDYVGQIGVYQVVLCTFLALFSFWGVEVVSITFIAGEMPHWCRVPELTSLPPAQQRYIAIPPSDGAGDYSQCSVYRLNFSRYSLEALRAWNRSDMVTADTPRMRCAHGWLYEPDLYLSTSVNRVSVRSETWQRESLQLIDLQIECKLPRITSLNLSKHYRYQRWLYFMLETSQHISLESYLQVTISTLLPCVVCSVARRYGAGSKPSNRARAPYYVLFCSEFRSVSSPSCVLRSTLCALRSALCALRSALCALRSASRVPRSAFRVPRSALCVLRSAFCVPRSAFRAPRSALCALHSAFSSVLCPAAPCPLKFHLSGYRESHHRM